LTRTVADSITLKALLTANIVSLEFMNQEQKYSYPLLLS